MEAAPEAVSGALEAAPEAVSGALEAAPEAVSGALEAAPEGLLRPPDEPARLSPRRGPGGQSGTLFFGLPLEPPLGVLGPR